MNYKVNILFRADGNSEIGLGHVYRCLAIAERIAGNFVCFFAIRQPSTELINIIGKSANIVVLDDLKDDIEEASYIATVVVPLYKIHIITLDGYHFNTAYQRVFKEKCKSVLVSIDDDQPFHYESDIVINHAGGIVASMFSIEAYTRLFLGYDFLLLRKEFMESLKFEKKATDMYSVLVCFGGADPDDFTGKILDCLKERQGIHKITVIIGASYTKTENLFRIAEEYMHIDIKHNLDAKSMAEIMFDTNLAIVPASTVGLEAFVSKAVLLLGMTAPNQINIYNGLIKEDSVIGVGNFGLLPFKSLQSAIDRAISKSITPISFSKNRVHNMLPELYKSLI